MKPKHLHSLGVFAVVSIVFLCCPVKGISDLIWSIPTAFSILREGNTDLDEYQPSFKQLGGQGIEVIAGHSRNYFPMGSTLVALVPLFVFTHAVNLVAPLATPFPRIAKGVSNWKVNFARTGEIDLSFFVVTEMVLASLLMALAAAFIHALAAEALPWNWALVVTGGFAFCSSVWSTASRDLGQHGPSVLMLSVALWLLVRARRVPSSAAWAGLFVGLSYVMRPTNSLSVVLLTVLVALRHRKFLLPYGGLLLAVLAPFCLFNGSVYSAILPPYYQPGRLVPESAALMLEALAGNLVSPARGLLVFSPLFLFSGYGLVLEWKRGLARVEASVFGLIIVLHWLTVSSFPHWWGGHSFGPRFLTDLTPYLCYFLIPVVERLRETPSRHRALLAALLLSGGWSAFTHLRGATSWAVASWNATPEGMDVDRHPERLWDFRDPPFFRGL